MIAILNNGGQMGILDRPDEIEACSLIAVRFGPDSYTVLKHQHGKVPRLLIRRRTLERLIKETLTS